MGVNSSLICNKVINNAYEVLAIEIITIIQAIDFLEIDKKVCSKTKSMYNTIRNIVPKFKEDDIIYIHINEVKNHIMNNDI
jgi:histidine ammonia-lyase